MACNNKITADIAYDCADAPIKGLDSGKAVLINWDDVDWTATTMASGAVSALVLKSGTSGFNVSWYKELGSVASSYTKNTEDVDGFSHSFMARLSTTTTANSLAANELKNGRFLVVVETAYKGASDAEAFKVYGFDTGMELLEMTQSSNENSGSVLFTLATREGTVERYPYCVYFDTSYAVTKADFDAKFPTV